MPWVCFDGLLLQARAGQRPAGEAANETCRREQAHIGANRRGEEIAGVEENVRFGLETSQASSPGGKPYNLTI